MSELPKGWVEAFLNELADIKTGKVDANHAVDDGQYRFYTCALLPLKSETYSFDGELILLPGNGANVGHVNYFNGKVEAYQRTYVVHNSKIDPKYLYFHMKAFWKFRNEEKQYGSATNYIKMGNFNNYTVAVPPLAEQKRIVEKLDQVLAKVDTIKARLDGIPAILKRFRQSVLAAAVSGKLTEEWRGSKSIKLNQPCMTVGESYDDSPIGWSWQKLTNLALLESGHTPRKSVDEYWVDGDVFWISLQDIREANGKVIQNTKYKPTMLGIENSSARLLPEGTVCFCRDISVGYVTIMGHSMSTTQHFANWVCRAQLNNKFLMFAFMAAKDHLINSGQGTTVKTIYMPALKELRMLAPPIEEQTEIVRLVDQYFAFADAIEQQVQKAQQRVDKLTQSILSKAFKGELVPQEHTLDKHYEPAEQLLKRIAAARAESEALAKAAKQAAKKTTKKAVKKS